MATTELVSYALCKSMSLIPTRRFLKENLILGFYWLEPGSHSGSDQEIWTDLVLG